jgi:hypothetical protein
MCILCQSGRVLINGPIGNALRGSFYTIYEEGGPKISCTDFLGLILSFPLLLRYIYLTSVLSGIFVRFSVSCDCLVSESNV